MKLILIALLLVTLAWRLLARLQQRLIYLPRPYPAQLPLPATAQILEYQTSQGSQTAFYLPPATSSNVGALKLWLLCGGNGSLALDWLELVANFPDPGAAFLLLDYPGYGRCQGRPNPKAIRESLAQALTTLAARLQIPVMQLQENLAALGHSLGAAVVLLQAGHHPVQRLILISPFTSLHEMAALVVGKTLSRTLLHNYDNRARLKEVLARTPIPPITIIHGSHDKIVPVAMGRGLAALSSGIDYREIDRGDHNYILLTHREEIRRAMLDQDPDALLKSAVERVGQ